MTDLDEQIIIAETRILLLARGRRSQFALILAALTIVQNEELREQYVHTKPLDLRAYGLALSNLLLEVREGTFGDPLLGASVA